MPRKRTPDEPSSEAESSTATATAEPEPARNPEPKQSFAERVGQRKERISAPDPFEIATDRVAGVRLFESKQDRQMAIQFDEKPIQSVIDRLKDARYQWKQADRIWAHPVPYGSPMSTRIEAERLYQEVCKMIRREKGIEAGLEIPF
jgi:hypothetical protein